MVKSVISQLQSVGEGAIEKITHNTATRSALQGAIQLKDRGEQLVTGLIAVEGRLASVEKRLAALEGQKRKSATAGARTAATKARSGAAKARAATAKPKPAAVKADESGS